MRDPAPPFLILGFYFARIPDHAALRRLTDTLAGLGGEVSGGAFVHRGERLRDRPFASITDLPQEHVPLASLPDLHRLFDHPDVRVVQVRMQNGTSATSDAAEFVGYEGISAEASRTDHHPVAIWSDGSVFSYSREEVPPLAGDAGRRVYERFRTLLDLLLPDFASITIEEPLQCPADLQQDPRSLAFRDFYVSATTIDCRRITKLFHEAYCEEVAAGVYVSTTRWFNPRAHALDRETAQFLSVEVAKWIAQT